MLSASELIALKIMRDKTVVEAAQKKEQAEVLARIDRTLEALASTPAPTLTVPAPVVNLAQMELTGRTIEMKRDANGKIVGAEVVVRRDLNLKRNELGQIIGAEVR